MCHLLFWQYFEMFAFGSVPNHVSDSWMAGIPYSLSFLSDQCNSLTPCSINYKTCGGTLILSIQSSTGIQSVKRSIQNTNTILSKC